MSVSRCRNCSRKLNNVPGPYCEPCGHTPKFKEPSYEDGLWGGEWVLDPVSRVQVWRAV